MDHYTLNVTAYIFEVASFSILFIGAQLLGLLRVGLTSGLAYAYFWDWRRDHWAHRKIQSTPLNRKIMWGEIQLSFWSAVISSFAPFIWIYLYRNGWTPTYLDISEKGWPYFFFSIFLLVMLHDAYFYWTHRLMHHKKVFKIVHEAHHRSKAPTPWAAWAFHPFEIILGSLFMYFSYLCIPMHPIAYVIFIAVLTLSNVAHHLGFEIAPKGASTHWFGRWINWGTHHDLHHKYYNCNYGSYFNFWDCLCSTNHPEYDDIYQNIVTRPADSAWLPEAK